MKKDIGWLKNEVKSLFDEAYDSGKMEYYESEESIHRINSLVDQLDEPETLSQQWIDENKVARINNLRKMTTSDVVPVEKLKNLLVPKQDNGFIVFEKDKLDEEVQRMIDETYKAMNEKPVIPQYVAEQLEYWERNRMNILWQFWLKEIPSSILWWLEGDENNWDKLLDAENNSYEVEKEKKYYIYDKSTKGYLGYNADKTKLSWYTSQFPNDVFTEQEIKSIDERYWAFAVEVTE